MTRRVKKAPRGALVPLPELRGRAAAQGACPGNCSWAGRCTLSVRGTVSTAGGGGVPFCRCLGTARHGDDCSKGGDWCLNQCRGRGRCVQGSCACQPGYWGADCSLSAAALAAALRHRPLRPALYVLDLPAALATWHLGLGRDTARRAPGRRARTGDRVACSRQGVEPSPEAGTPGQRL